MPTLSQFPLFRLAPLRRVPFWAQALALCALFAIAGVAVLDDYGMALDEDTQRKIAIANADYIATGGVDGRYGLYNSDYRYYGVAFEMPLLLVERALGLQDTRHIYLTRHLLTHLFFIAGGFACGMLAYRMFGSRWVAMFAMLMFLLHPRLYGHSFVNTKDIPFAALFVIALYLAHRAFRRDTLGAFLLCGIGVGLAINLRPFALILLPMIPAMLAPDFWQASGRGERRRILIAGAAFLAAALGAAYIIHPYYWENPLRFIETILVVSQHPFLATNLFMGEIYLADAVPWNYIPVWFAITAPPAALSLGAIGCAAVCWQAITRPLAALSDRETRFRLLLLGCFALPIVVVIALQSNFNNHWRQMYFLWAPFCLLAAVGLRAIANIHLEGGIWKVGTLLPGWVRGGGLRRTLAYGVAGVGLITTLTAMAALHPYEYVYFNALTDTKTPGALGKRHDIDQGSLAHRQMLEYLLARYPDDTLRVWNPDQAMMILPQKDRERVLISRNLNSADYHIPYGHRRNTPTGPMLHSVKAYGSVFGYILAPKNAAAYYDVEANGTLLTRADFDIYIHNGELYYLNADCEPPSASSVVWVFLHIFPTDPTDLPAGMRSRGFENLDFRLDRHAAFFEGKCVHRQPLPDYSSIARIRTGQNVAAGGGDEWRVDVNMAAHAAASVVYDGIHDGDYGAPVAQSRFDVYMRDNGLTYLRAPCAPDDTDARFFLHIFPADSAALPADGREFGFANLDFQFADHGANIGGKCVAERELPDYAIERIRTGQFVSGGGEVWRAEIELRE